MHFEIRLRIIYLLVVLGVLGNLLTSMILKFKKGLRTLTKMIFALQAVADLMLVTWQVIHLVYGSLQPNPSRFIDKFFEFMSRSFVCYSFWCVALVDLERICLVMWPTNPIIRRAAFKESGLITF